MVGEGIGTGVGHPRAGWRMPTWTRHSTLFLPTEIDFPFVLPAFLNFPDSNFLHLALPAHLLCSRRLPSNSRHPLK